MVQIQKISTFLVIIVSVVVNSGLQLKTATCRTGLLSRYYAPLRGITSGSTSQINMSTNNRASSMAVGRKFSQRYLQPRGFFNVVGISSKFFVTGIATLVLYGTSSWIPLYYILCSVLNGALSKGIKKIVKQPRPPQSDKTGYGMPSSHTQAFFFFVAVVSVNAPRFLNIKYSALLSLSLLIYSIVASYWRVAAGIHSFSQTLVGAVIGLLFGLFISKGEMVAIAKLKPLLGDSMAVPILVKLPISTLGFLVTCNSELLFLLKLIRDATKNNRNSYEI